MDTDHIEKAYPEESPRKRSRGKDPLLRLFKGLLGLFLFAILVHSLAVFATGRAVNREIERVKAAGLPTTFAEMLEPAPLPRENAAPLYEQAFQHMEVLKQQKVRKNIDSYTSVQKRLSDSTLLPKARKDLPKYREVIALTRAAAARSRCQYPVDWASGPQGALEYYSTVRSLCRVLYVDALIKAHDGQIDESLRSIALIYRAADSLKEDPTLIGMLARGAASKIGGGALREALLYGDPSEAEARRLHDTLAAVDFSGAGKRALEGEMLYGMLGFDTAKKNPRDLTGVLPNSGGAPSPVAPLMGGLAHLWRPMLNGDEIVYLRRMRKIVASNGLPYRVTHSQPDPAQDIPKYAILSRILFQAYGNSNIMADLAQTDAAQARIALALTVYKKRYSAYPDSLPQLRSRLGWEIPLDPFSGKEFGYRKKGNGFLLYSVGQDLKDDGGTPVNYHQYRLGAGITNPSAYPKQPLPAGGSSSTGDLLWQRVR